MASYWTARKKSEGAWDRNCLLQWRHNVMLIPVAHDQASAMRLSAVLQCVLLTGQKGKGKIQGVANNDLHMSQGAFNKARRRCCATPDFFLYYPRFSR
jgi:hypothetical protein